MWSRLIQREAQPSAVAMGLETTHRVPISHVLNSTNVHYVFYCDSQELYYTDTRAEIAAAALSVRYTPL